MKNGLEFPWNNWQSILFALFVFAVGLVPEWIIGHKAIYMPQWPYNFIFLIAIILYLFLLYAFKKVPFISWLSSTQASIGAITVYTVLVICMGLIPQNSETNNLFLRKLVLTIYPPVGLL